MKKLFCLASALILLLSLTGCSSDDNIVEITTEYCEVIKNADAEALGIENPFDKDLGYLSADAMEYLESCAKKMTYAIGEPIVSRETATVLVNFTYLDITPIAEKAIEDYTAHAFALSLNGTEYIPEELFDTVFMETTETTSPTEVKKTFELAFIKKDGEWELQSLEEEILYAIISCNIDEAEALINKKFNSADEEKEYIWHEIPLGKELKLTSIKLTVTDYEERAELTADEREPEIAPNGTKFVILTVEVENITKPTFAFNNSFTLCDDKGREYTPYTNAFLYFDETFVSTELVSGDKKVGYFVYNVLDDAEFYYITTGKAGTNEAYRLIIK